MGLASETTTQWKVSTTVRRLSKEKKPVEGVAQAP